MNFLTEERERLFKRVVSKTQFDATVLLENVHDPHNLGAVMRSCDAVGIREVYILDNHDNLKPRVLEDNMKTSTGVMRWIEIHRFIDTEACVKALRLKYDKLLATHLSEDASSMHEQDFTSSCVLVFGNEHAGITDELYNHCDGNFIIPQMGMVQSLNISVACAVSLFELARQRIEAGKYQDDYNSENVSQKALFDLYADRQTMNRRLGS